MEAPAAGRPVVATRRAGVAGPVEDGVPGLLVHPGDADGLAAAILRRADDPGLRARMGVAGRLAVGEGFDARQEAARMARLLGGDLSGGPRFATLAGSSADAAPVPVGASPGGPR